MSEEECNCYPGLSLVYHHTMLQTFESVIGIRFIDFFLREIT